MTPAERALWTRVIRRASILTPELTVALYSAFALLRENLTDAELTRIIELGYADKIVGQLISQAVMSAAMQPVRDGIRRGIVRSFKYFARDLPAPPASVRSIGVTFDVLNPRVIDAIRQLETRVITSLEDSIRETVRAYVENGLRDGVSSSEIARSLRDVIGLGPSQLQEVENFRAALGGEEGRNPLAYKLRDRRFDKTIAKGELSPAQIDKMTEAYRKRRIALNAETNARTAAVDAQKLAHHLTWEDAIDKGIVDRSKMTKRWVGVMDDRERPEHVAMEGETVGFDDPFSNGEMIPGESTYNCRCIARYSQSLN